jgi:release factor glutamine methyltransferase
LTATSATDARPTPILPSSLDVSAPVGLLLEQTTAAFEAIGMPLARRWAKTLVATVLDVPHRELDARAAQMLSLEQRRRFEKIARQTSPDVPLAYEIGRAPFLNWDFEVSRETLIPKVDTELFAGIVLDELARRPLPPEPHVLELCTGSGCLAISLAKLLPRARVVATDVSPGALAVARRNLTRHRVEDRIVLGQGDLWGPVARLAAGRPFDLVVSNPPYIPTQNIAGMGRHVAEHEPYLALDGGADGLDPHRRILDEAADYLASGGRVFLEHEWYHGAPARALAERHPGRYDDARTFTDTNNKDRALFVRRRVASGLPAHPGQAPQDLDREA